MRVGFDIGGTFTDVIVLRDDGTIDTAKVLSLLDRVGHDIITHIRQSGTSEQIDNFVHGTTIASNAVIEAAAYGASMRTMPPAAMVSLAPPGPHAGHVVDASNETRTTVTLALSAS